MSLMSLTAVELGKKIQAKEVTAVEAAREAFLQIERMDSKIHCMITVDKEGALERAEKVQERIF